MKYGNNSSKIPFTPKVEDFEKNNFLKLISSSQPIIEGMSLGLVVGLTKHINLDNARNSPSKICHLWR